jgi:hypothetical protein
VRRVRIAHPALAGSKDICQCLQPEPLTAQVRNLLKKLHAQAPAQVGEVDTLCINREYQVSATLGD